MLTKIQITRIQKGLKTEDERILLILRILSDPGRFRIFKLLIKHRGICVTDVAGILNISVPAASQQLKTMELAGLVRKNRKGQTMCYQLKTESPHVKSIIKFLTKKS